jgi:hypothetical protein
VGIIYNTTIVDLKWQNEELLHKKREDNSSGSDPTIQIIIGGIEFKIRLII